MLGGQKQQTPETVIQSRQESPQETEAGVGCGWWGGAAPGERGQGGGVGGGRGLPQERRGQAWGVGGGARGHSRAWPFIAPLPGASLAGLGAGARVWGLGNRQHEPCCPGTLYRGQQKRKQIQLKRVMVAEA